MKGSHSASLILSIESSSGSEEGSDGQQVMPELLNEAFLMKATCTWQKSWKHHKEPISYATLLSMYKLGTGIYVATIMIIDRCTHIPTHRTTTHRYYRLRKRDWKPLTWAIDARTSALRTPRYSLRPWKRSRPLKEPQNHELKTQDTARTELQRRSLPHCTHQQQS